MRKKGLLGLILTLSISLFLALPAHASFSDVSDPNLNSIITELSQKGIISGFPDGTFRPESPLTRAQMAALIFRAKNIPITPATDKMSFSDVPADHWASTCIKACAAEAIVKGYPDGTFRPNQPLTRGELARFLQRALGMPEYLATRATFKDVPLSPAKYWAFDEIETVNHYKIMTGYDDGLFRPAQKATRAEIAVSIYRMLNVNVKPIRETDGRTIVAVDPGHGGSDPGAIAKSNGLQEKDVNLAVGLIVRDLLKSAGVEVVMTRSDDTFVSLSGRADIANNANADIFVSIHHNSAESTAAVGTEVYSYPGSADGALLAEMIQDELIKAFGWSGVPNKDRGTKTANFAVLRLTSMPAALCEPAFMSNSEEAALLATDEFRRKEAQGIYNGIIRYLSQKPH